VENLAILANIAEIVGAIIVVVGLLFAVLQMRQIQQQRRELAAIELFRFFGNPRFTRAFNRVLHMPDKLTAEKMRRDEKGLEDAAMLISAKRRTMISSSNGSSGWSVNLTSMTTKTRGRRTKPLAPGYRSTC
jgi:hypothetical protein